MCGNIIQLKECSKTYKHLENYYRTAAGGHPNPNPIPLCKDLSETGQRISEGHEWNPWTRENKQKCMNRGEDKQKAQTGNKTRKQ